MKQLIIDKIDRLIEQGSDVEEISGGYVIGKIVAYIDQDYRQKSFYVRYSDLDDRDSKFIYEYLREKKHQQFIEYLKGD